MAGTGKKTSKKSSKKRVSFRKKTPAKKPYTRKSVDTTVKKPAHTPASSISYMSPWNKVSPPLNDNSLGNFLTVNLVSKYSLTTSTTKSIIVWINSSARGVYQGGAWDQDGLNLSPSNIDLSPAFKFSTSDIPLSYRPLRSGVRIRNITSNQNVGGLVRVLQQSSPVVVAWAGGGNTDIFNTIFDDWRAAIQSSPKTVEYTGHSFVEGTNEFVISPATMAAYNSYGPLAFVFAVGTATYKTQMEAQETDMAMNNLLLEFPATDVANVYSITVMHQVALRYPTNTLLSDLSRPHVLPANSDTIKKTHSDLANHGSQKAPPNYTVNGYTVLYS